MSAADQISSLFEINTIQATQIQSLKKKLAAAEASAESYERRQIQMEKDFAFNLQVIEERDKDISELSDKMDKIKNVVLDKNKLITEMEERVRIVCERNDYLRDENKALKIRSNNMQEDLEKLKDLSDKVRVQEDKRVKETVSLAIKVKDEEIEKLRIEIARIGQEAEDKVKKIIEGKRQSEWSINQQNQRLEEKINEVRVELVKQEEEKKKLQDEIQFQKKRNVEMQIDLNGVKKEKEMMEVGRASWQSVFEEKMNVVIEERDRFREKLADKKEKMRRKLKEEQDKMDRKMQIDREDNEFYLKQLQSQNRELEMERERADIEIKRLKEFMEERENRKNKEIQLLEEKFKKLRKIQEDTLKQQMSDKNLIEFHLKTKADEMEEINYQLKRQKEDKDRLQKDFEEIRAENELLIGELVQYRRRKDIKNDRQKPNLNVSLQFEEDNFLKQKKSDKKGHFNENNNQNNSNNNANDSYEKLFSDDMGPASPMRGKNYNLDFLSNNRSASQLVSSIIAKNKLNANLIFNSGVNQIQHRSTHSHDNESKLQLRNNSRAQLAERIQSMESELDAYKHLIETMALEMEGVNTKLQQEKQELESYKQANLELKQKQADLNGDLINQREKLLKNEKTSEYIQEKEEEIESKEQEIQQLKRNIDKFRTEIGRLRAERTQLDAITAEMQHRIRDLQDELEEIKQQQQDSENKLSQPFLDGTSIYKKVRNDSQSNIAHIDIDYKNLSFDISGSSRDALAHSLSKRHSRKQSPISDSYFTKDLQARIISNSAQNLRHSRNPSPQLDDYQLQKPKLQTPKVNVKKEVPKYDNFMEIDNQQQEKYQSNQQYQQYQQYQQQQQYYQSQQQYGEGGGDQHETVVELPDQEDQGLILISNQKQIVERQQQYLPNSQKETPSQTLLKQKEASKSQDRNSSKGSDKKKKKQKEEERPNKLKIRNYSVKDNENIVGEEQQQFL